MLIKVTLKLNFNSIFNFGSKIHVTAAKLILKTFLDQFVYFEKWWNWQNSVLRLQYLDELEIQNLTIEAFKTHFFSKNSTF